MSTRGAPDFNHWLTHIHGFKVGASRNSYTVADLEAAWNAAERAWKEVANKNAQERNAAVDREVVLLEALKMAHRYFLQSNKLTVDDREMLDEMWAAIKQAERGQ